MARSIRPRGNKSVYEAIEKYGDIAQRDPTHEINYEIDKPSDHLAIVPLDKGVHGIGTVRGYVADKVPAVPILLDVSEVLMK